MSGAGFLDRDLVSVRVGKVFGKLADDMPSLKGAALEESSKLSRDLGLDSLEQTELLMAVEEEFGVSPGAAARGRGATPPSPGSTQAAPALSMPAMGQGGVGAPGRSRDAGTLSPER